MLRLELGEKTRCRQEVELVCPVVCTIVADVVVAVSVFVVLFLKRFCWVNMVEKTTFLIFFPRCVSERVCACCVFWRKLKRKGTRLVIIVVAVVSWCCANSSDELDRYEQE